LKRINLLKSIFIFFVGLFLIGCATQNNQLDEAEVWNEVESIDDFIGKWEGYAVSHIPSNADKGLPESSLEMSISFEYIEGSKEVNGAIKVDMNRFLTDWVNMAGIKEAGFTKDILWKLLSEQFEKMEGIIISGRYYILNDISDSVDTFFENDSVGKFQINKSKNKAKLIYYEALSFGLGDAGFNEIIFNKR
jgi:hypothetical protein